MKLQSGGVLTDDPYGLRPEAEDATDPYTAPPTARSGGAQLRDTLYRPRLVRSFHRAARKGEEAEVRTVTLGWVASLVLNLFLLAAPFGLVLALPPVLACRDREEQFGFFAGETLTSCSTAGIRERVRKLDDRIKMLVRGSGR